MVNQERESILRNFVILDHNSLPSLTKNTRFQERRGSNSYFLPSAFSRLHEWTWIYVRREVEGKNICIFDHVLASIFSQR